MDKPPKHLSDEECDLFPLMLERCDPDEEVDKMITRLQADHRHARRHLILENAILLPLACARLSKADLEKMRAHMLERGGQATEQGAGYVG